MQGMIQATPQEWMVMLSRTASQLDHAREVLRRMGNNGVGYRPTHNTRLQRYIYEIARRATVMERNIVRVKILFFLGFFFQNSIFLFLRIISTTWRTGILSKNKMPPRPSTHRASSPTGRRVWAWMCPGNSGSYHGISLTEREMISRSQTPIHREKESLQLRY